MKPSEIFNHYRRSATAVGNRITAWLILLRIIAASPKGITRAELAGHDIDANHLYRREQQGHLAATPPLSQRVTGYCGTVTYRATTDLMIELGVNEAQAQAIISLWDHAQTVGVRDPNYWMLIIKIAAHGEAGMSHAKYAKHPERIHMIRTLLAGRVISSGDEKPKVYRVPEVIQKRLKLTPETSPMQELDTYLRALVA